MPIHTHKTEEPTNKLTPKVAIHDHNGEKYCSLVIKGKLYRVTPDDPRVTAMNETIRVIHEIEQKGGIGAIPTCYAVMALSSGLRGDQLPRFYEAMQTRSKSIPEIINDLLNELPDEPIMSFGEMKADPNILEKEGVVSDLIRKEDKTVLASGSKAYKTWNLVNVATSVVAGTEWLGFPCKSGRVLIINFELHKFDLRKRISKVAASKGISEECLNDNLHTWNLRGRDNDVDKLVAELIRKVRASQYDMIIFDPTYKMLGNRSENDAAEMTQLVNKLEEAAVRLKVAVVFAVHFPKGDMSKRQAIDRMSGSGVFGRDPDTIMIMSDLTDKERQQLSGIKTESKTEKEELSGTQKVVLKKLTEPSSYTDWLKAAEAVDVSKDSFNNTLKKLQKLEYVEKLETGHYAQTEKGKAVKLGFTSKATASKKAKQVNPSLIGAQKIEFTLRNRAPQESIVVKFNLEKCVHEVLPVSGGVLDAMDAAKDEVQADAESGDRSPLRFTYGPGTITATCEASEQAETYNIEGRDKPPGEAKRALFNLFNDSCPCGLRHLDANGEQTEMEL
jgi:RecA-family ATPase